MPRDPLTQQHGWGGWPGWVTLGLVAAIGAMIVAVLCAPLIAGAVRRWRERG